MTHRYDKLLSRRAVLAVTFLAALAIILSAMQAARHFGALQELDKLQQGYVLAQSAARLVHELQLERGLSTGFMASRGTRFVDALAGQRANMDTCLDKFTAQAMAAAAVRGHRAGVGPVADGLEGRIARLRATVDKLDEGEDVFRAYSREVEGMLSLATRSLRVERPSPGIRQVLLRTSAYLALLRAKEAFGVERALVGRILSAQYRRAGQEVADGLERALSEQQSQLGLFFDLAPPQLARAVKERLNGGLPDELARVRTDFAEGQPLLGDPERWFSAASENIEFMNWSADLLGEQISETYESSKDVFESKMQIGIAFTATALVAMLLLWMSATLLRSLRSQENLIDSIDGVVWESDQERKHFAFVSRQAASLMGFGAEALRAPEGWDGRIHPDDRAEVRQRIEQGVKSATTFDLEYRMLSGDGSTVWVHDRVSVVASGGRPVRLRGVLVVITALRREQIERKAVEGTLRESRERLATLIESIPDAIFFKDGDSRWQVINDAAKRLFRIGDLPWQGRTDAELALLQPALSGEHLACCKSDEMAWRNRSTIHVTEIFHQEDGGTLVYNVCKVPLFDEEGERRALVIHARDVTDQYRHAEALQRLNDELEQRVSERTRELQAANREMEAFSYSVSHDLRAPLRAINGFSLLLDEEYAGVLDDKARNYLSRVRAGSERMGHLIDALLHLSQMSSKPMRIDRADLSGLAAEVAAEIQAGEPARAVEWIIAPDIFAHGDERLLRAVLLNLLGNAWKYSAKRADARIEFGVERKDGRPAYFVRDNGAGFDMAHAKRLFGAFQRLHSPAEFPGNGIGLATVARIVHRHGGEVWAESSPGDGATFYFTLRSETRSELTKLF
jgi:PAS domain S-box-containing protein